VRPLVFDRDMQVGGLARTVVYKNFRFDIRRHRFFTKATAVRDLWHELLGKDLLQRPRLSRIYTAAASLITRSKAFNVVTNLGLVTSVAVLASYVGARLRPIRPEVSLRTGSAIARPAPVFDVFRELHRKGVGHSLRSDWRPWAAQRIKGLSLWTAVLACWGSREAARSRR